MDDATNGKPEPPRPRTPWKRWSAADDALLRNYVTRPTRKRLAQQLGRSVAAIQDRLRVLREGGGTND